MKGFKNYVYLLKSKKDSSYYIGQTGKELNERLNEHNQGLSVYTSKKRPWKIVYYEIFKNRKEAMQREQFLKKQRNREFYERLIRTGSSAG